MESSAIRAQTADMLAHMTLAMLGEAAMLIARSPKPKAARAEARDVINRLIDALVR